MAGRWEIDRFHGLIPPLWGPVEKMETLFRGHVREILGSNRWIINIFNGWDWVTAIWIIC